MATALHAVGTVGAGAAIAMVGQIFNMQEHWPAAVLLWALCAGAGWFWLRDQFQQVCLLLLAPAWLVCEWSYRASVYRGGEVYCLRMVAVIAAVYLTAFLHFRSGVRCPGFFLASPALRCSRRPRCLPKVDQLCLECALEHPMLPIGLRVAAVFVMVLMFAAGWVWEKRSLVPALVVTAMSFALPWLQAKVHDEWMRGSETRDEPSVLAYALVAAVSVFLAWWGVRERSRALVNYGIAAFAVTVIWFLLLQPDGQAGPFAWTDWVGCAVPRRWLAAGAHEAAVADADADGGGRMTLRAKGVAVLVVQLVLVLSIAAKYAWERHACPRVWTRATQYDPEQPIRGRYIALSLHASACGLPPGKDGRYFPRRFFPTHGEERGWTVLPAAHDGKLAPVVADEMKPGETETLTLGSDLPCEFATLSGETDFFIPEHAKTPFPLGVGEELWAEVTVPPSGPPRPVRLAVSDGKNFRVLDLR